MNGFFIPLQNILAMKFIEFILFNKNVKKKSRIVDPSVFVAEIVQIMAIMGTVSITVRILSR